MKISTWIGNLCFGWPWQLHSWVFSVIFLYFFFVFVFYIEFLFITNSLLKINKLPKFLFRKEICKHWIFQMKRPTLHLWRHLELLLTQFKLKWVKWVNWNTTPWLQKKLHRKQRENKRSVMQPFLYNVQGRLFETMTFF